MFNKRYTIDVTMFVQSFSNSLTNKYIFKLNLTKRFTNILTDVSPLNEEGQKDHQIHKLSDC